MKQLIQHAHYLTHAVTVRLLELEIVSTDPRPVGSVLLELIKKVLCPAFLIQLQTVA